MPGDSSYDDIVRRTILMPDTSRKPSREEEELARHRAGAAADHIPHPLSAAEERRLAAAERALAADPSIDMSHVNVTVDCHEIVLKGNVPGPATRARIEDVVRAIEGVERVDNQLVIRSYFR